jgi:hypothetical protein
LVFATEEPSLAVGEEFDEVVEDVQVEEEVETRP